jgi:hypothetical protein
MNTTREGALPGMRQEDLKCPKLHAVELLKSSNGLGWSTPFADLRSHSRYEGPGLPRRRMRKLGS